MIVIRAIRQLGNNDVLVFAVDTFKEPDSSFTDGPGKCDARDNIIEVQPLLELGRGKEIGCRETEVIVGVCVAAAWTVMDLKK